MEYEFKSGRNRLEHDAAWKIGDLGWFQDRYAGSFIPARKGKYEVRKLGHFQCAFRTSKEARAYIASCAWSDYELSRLVTLQHYGIYLT